MNLARVIIKVGSSVLTDARGQLLPARIEQLCAQLAQCIREHRQPLLVSSGAIACGMARLGLTRRPKALAQLQACAAIGQGELMRLYTAAFERHGVMVGQVLLTQEDLSDRRRYQNAKQTLLTLLHRRVVPIINENDTVAVEEITFGDNDRLAALVACAVDGQLLILLTDVDGVLEHGQPMARIETARSLAHIPLQRHKRQTTKGGMSSKLEAARIAGHSGLPTVIANGMTPGIIGRILAGEAVGTLVVPPPSRLTAKRWWIAFGLRQPKGRVVVDAGAVQALHRGKSLLYSGIEAVRGGFESGHVVALVDGEGREIARGVSTLSAIELNQVKGLSSAEAARQLGRPRLQEAIHRDHLVLAQEWATT
jgi:glutamate 5-kinase